MRDIHRPGFIEQAAFRVKTTVERDRTVGRVAGVLAAGTWLTLGEGMLRGQTDIKVPLALLLINMAASGHFFVMDHFRDQGGAGQRTQERK